LGPKASELALWWGALSPPRGKKEIKKGETATQTFSTVKRRALTFLIFLELGERLKESNFFRPDKKEKKRGGEISYVSEVLTVKKIYERGKEKIRLIAAPQKSGKRRRGKRRPDRHPSLRWGEKKRGPFRSVQEFFYKALTPGIAPMERGGKEKGLISIFSDAKTSATAGTHAIAVIKK